MPRVDSGTNHFFTLERSLVSLGSPSRYRCRLEEPDDIVSLKTDFPWVNSTHLSRVLPEAANDSQTMSRQNALSRDLNVEDFRRLGVRPNEVRLNVIRGAASRNAMPLANELLASSYHNLNENHPANSQPSDADTVASRTHTSDSDWAETWLQLSRVVTSTYRLLDPRLRPNPHQRAYIGRILPLALTAAGATSFNISKPVRQTQRFETARPVPPPVSDAFGKPDITEDLFAMPTAQLNDAEIWQLSLDDHDFASGGRIRRQRNRSKRNIWIWSSMAAIGILAGSVLGWNSVHENLPKDPSGKMAANASIAKVETQPSQTPSVMRKNENFVGGTVTRMPMSDEASTPPSPSKMPNLVAEKETLPIEPKLVIESLPEVTSQPIAVTEASPTESIDIEPMETEAVDSSTSNVMKAATDKASESSPGVTQDLFAVPFPEDIAMARRRILQAANADGVSITQLNLPTIRDWVTNAQSNYSPGSVDHFTAGLILGSFEWLQPGPRSASLTSMASRLDAYQIDEADVWKQSYIDACEHVTLPEELEPFFFAGLGLIETLIKRQAIDQAGEVLASIQLRSDLFAADLLDETDSDKVGLRSLIASYQKSLKYAKRLATSAERVIRLNGNIESIPADVSGGSSLGRYHCLVLGDWCQGLRFLAETSDPRLAAISKSEIEMHTEDAFFSDATAWADMANQWNAVAERLSGRAAFEVRLHAIELLEQSSARTGATAKDNARQQIEAIKQRLPSHLTEDLEAADPDAEIPVAVKSETNSPLLETPNDDTASAMEVNSANDWLVGRMTLEGEDLGIRLRYQLDAGINSTMLKSIEGQLRRSLSDALIEFEGTFRCEKDQWVILALSPQSELNSESVFLNREPVQIDSLDRTNRVLIPAGRHSLRWEIKLSNAETILACSLRDAETGERLELSTSPQDAENVSSSDLTVSIMRSSQQP